MRNLLRFLVAPFVFVLMTGLAVWAEEPACPLEGNWRFEPDFSDEFNADSLDAEKWFPKNPGWLGRQPGWFSPDNVTVEEGCLCLTARNEDLPNLPEGYHTFTTAAVQSKKRVLYGYFEVKSRPMNAIASSSFWFYGVDPGEWTEIDVYEMSGAHPQHENIYHMNLHVMIKPDKGENHWNRGKDWTAPFLLRDDFHRYGLLWNEKTIAWFVDDEKVWETENTDWHQPLTVNFDSETMPEWFGLPKPEELPATFKIDYIRHWVPGE